MARLTGRGQLLLAGAFVLAVTLIGLTVVFSAGNYTNVMASEDPGAVSGNDPVAIRQSVRADLESALRLVHRKYSPGSTRRTSFETIVSEIGSGLRNHYARRGRLVDVSLPGSPYIPGERIMQPDDNPFTVPSAASPASWELTTGQFVRNMTFVFSDVPSSADPHFKIVFDVLSGSPNRWVVAVYENTATNEWKVNVKHEKSGSTLFAATCSRVVTGDDMVVNLSAGKINGEHCSALAALDPGIRYKVKIRNGDQARGRFWMTTPDTPIGLNACSRGPSTCRDAIFSATVNFRYQSGSVDYVTPIRIWPGAIQ